MRRLPTDYPWQVEQARLAFGRAVQAKRLARGMSAQAFADSLGVTRRTIYRWESGHGTFESVLFLCHRLDIDIRRIA